MENIDMENEIKGLLSQIEMNTRLAAKTILTQEEAAVYLGLTLRNLADRTRARTIPCFRQDRHYYYRREELDAWMTKTPVRTKGETCSEAATYLAIGRRRKSNGESCKTPSKSNI